MTNHIDKCTGSSCVISIIYRLCIYGKFNLLLYHIIMLAFVRQRKSILQLLLKMQINTNYLYLFYIIKIKTQGLQNTLYFDS